MSDVSGIPNMGFGGGSYFGGNAATGQPAWSAAQINASMGLPQAQAAQRQAMASLYGGGSFGAQPAYYAALGAAYGRQVAPSSPAAVASYFGRTATPAYSGGGIGSDAARSPNQGRLSGLYDQSMYAPAANPMSAYFSRLTGSQQPNPVSSSPGYPYYSPHSYSPAVTRAPTMPSSMRLLGYDPATSGQWAPNTNAYRPLGGAMQFPNSGTPSQYYSPAQQPPSFQQPYSIDQPGGALPLRPGQNWYGGMQSSS